MNYTYKDVIAKITNKWFILDRQAKWSHELRFHPETLVHILVPKHAWKTISKWVIKEIIKSLGISNRDFQNL